MSDTDRETVVLGLGNLLRRDEGLGIHALERLQAAYMLPVSVQMVDGGTLGLDLLCYLEQAERLLILDAALTENVPGTLLRMAGQAIPAFFGMRTSPHEIALPDLLAVTRLRGTAPRELVFLGMQPAIMELGWGLSEPVTAHLDELVDAAADELRRWGLPITKRRLLEEAEVSEPPIVSHQSYVPITSQVCLHRHSDGAGDLSQAALTAARLYNGEENADVSGDFGPDRRDR